VANRKLEFSRGDTIANKYEVVDLLDESPLGLTYRVKHIKTGKYVRLTLLRPKIAGREQKDQILQTFKTARELQHPHLLKIGELSEHDGVAYYTMEDFEGSSLRELLQEYRISGKQFGIKESSQITMQILEAVKAANDAGLVIRSLRPEYVLVNVRYTGPRRQTFVAQVKLFGVGFWGLVPSAVLAEDEFTRGEAQYLAPELKSFQPVPTERSDVYSTGVIFYEMLVGSAPVGTFQLPRARRPELPEHLNDVAELALAAAPEDRYQTAGDFITDIQRTFQDGALAGETAARPLVTPLGWALALAFVLLVGVILFNVGGNPELEAQAKTAEIRLKVSEDHDKPPAHEVMSILQKHPQNMTYVPGGPYVSGRIYTEQNVRAAEPLMQVLELKSFLIDVFEYPNLQGENAARNVTFKEAQNLCQRVGKRMCTATEWEKACKGPQNLVYSYGDDFNPKQCGRGLESPLPSGSYQNCKSGWGAYDMSGNFREWTATTSGSNQNRRIVKGGLKANPAKGTRCATSNDQAAAFEDSSLSFRCCRDVDAPPAPKR
jgi:serine/threonine protein kinase